MIKKILLLLFLLKSSLLFAAEETIYLEDGWNLISLTLQPSSNAPEVVFDIGENAGQIKMVWGYDAANQQWETYPAPITAITEISSITAGKGYWVKANGAQTITISGESADGSQSLSQGWNLIGFQLESAKHYQSVFNSDSNLSKIWRFDPLSKAFQGIEKISGSNGISQEDFQEIQPNVGYWVYITASSSIQPVLTTVMPADIDLPPLVPNQANLEVPPWTENERSFGDIEIGDADGYLDTPSSQRSITFGNNQTTQSISIFNSGTGILNWNARIKNSETASWLKFEVYNQETESYDLTTDVSGSQAYDAYSLKLVADRLGLTEKFYEAEIEITSNGDANEQATRTIDVTLFVDGIQGDYEAVVKITKVNGVESTSIANSKFYLSLYEDESGKLKGQINGKRSLLIPSNLYLTGSYFSFETKEFTLTGVLFLEVGHPMNPFPYPLRRDITLKGDRPGAADTGANPLDLVGTYEEAIVNLKYKNISVEGTFQAKRLVSKPTLVDEITNSEESIDLPETGSSWTIESTTEVPENFVITEVDVSMTLNHSRPEELEIYLISPPPISEEILLRDHTDYPTGTFTYDETALPFETLEALKSLNAQGVWTLRIENQSGLGSGELEEWELKLKGTSVYSAGGNLGPELAGGQVLIQGCGISELVDIQADGSYQINELVNCDYTATIIHPAYDQTQVSFFVQNEDEQVALNKEQKEFSAADADFLISAVQGYDPLKITLIDISSYDPELERNYTWKIYQWDQVTGNSSDYIQLPSSSNFYRIYTINDPGTYSVEMIVRDQTGDLISSIHKENDKIQVGVPSAGDFEFRNISTLSTAGYYRYDALGVENDEPSPAEWVSGFGNSEQTFESATFDLIYQPNSADINVVQSSDINAFLGAADFDPGLGIVGGVNPLTGTNALGNNNTLDSAVGGKGYKIRVSIGAPIIGISVSPTTKLYTGKNFKD